MADIQLKFDRSVKNTNWYNVEMENNSVKLEDCLVKITHFHDQYQLHIIIPDDRIPNKQEQRLLTWMRDIESAVMSVSSNFRSYVGKGKFSNGHTFTDVVLSRINYFMARDLMDERRANVEIYVSKAYQKIDTGNMYIQWDVYAERILPEDDLRNFSLIDGRE